MLSQPNEQHLIQEIKQYGKSIFCNDNDSLDSLDLSLTQNQQQVNYTSKLSKPYLFTQGPFLENNYLQPNKQPIWKPFATKYNRLTNSLYQKTPRKIHKPYIDIITQRVYQPFREYINCCQRQQSQNKHNLKQMQAKWADFIDRQNIWLMAKNNKLNKCKLSQSKVHSSISSRKQKKTLYNSNCRPHQCTKVNFCIEKLKLQTQQLRAKLLGTKKHKELNPRFRLE